MLKRLLLSAVILSAVGVSSYAVDVNIPGADPSISKDAYQNYRKIDKTARDMELRQNILTICLENGQWMS